MKTEAPIHDGNTVVFLGPTLSVEEASAILPAIYAPPARYGDAISLVTPGSKPLAVILIDGCLGDSQGMLHKEILCLIEQRVSVYGASGLGALRAVETKKFGMVGFGNVFKMFDSGELQDDDEVACAYTEVHGRYKRLSEPMVNIRATLLRAGTAGILTPSDAQLTIGVAKRFFYRDRTWQRILAGALGAGMRRDTVEALSTWVVGGYTDLQREDAIGLLRHLAACQPKEPPKFSFSRSHYFQALYERERTVRRDGNKVSLDAIQGYAALNMKEYHNFSFAAMNQELVSILADTLRVQVTESEIEEERGRFLARLGTVDHPDFARWLRDNDCSEEEFTEFILTVAKCRKLHRWLNSALYKRGSTKVILNFMRWIGIYGKWADRAAQNRNTDSRMGHSRISNDELGALCEEHGTHTGVFPDIALPLWVVERGFPNVDEFRLELVRAKESRLAQMNRNSRKL